MKFCRIEPDNQEYFDSFLSTSFADSSYDKNQLTIGMFDEIGPLGAFTVCLNDYVAEIRSLLYAERMKAGECEKAILDFIRDQDWEIYRIELIVGGTDRYFAEYDFAMLDIGFMPSQSDISLYTATIGEIAEAQGDMLERFEKKYTPGEFKTGKELTKYELDQYNRMYPFNRYFPNDENRDLSCFLFKDGEIMAGITARKLSDSQLEFQWMDTKHVNRQETMKLIMFTTWNAMKQVEKEATVSICPFTDEVQLLVQKFGFRQSSRRIGTRVYSCYVE